ncbi:hypothetical protein [Listeria aquatica]|uniref:hypothetical protein n=1 Tax=Listeria aquatica TaxID=1494960 RepID=UPI003F4AAE29
MEAYISDPKNFTIVSATTIEKVAPALLELFEAPYGTDLCWLYENHVLTGFYDLVGDQETDIETILESKKK